MKRLLCLALLSAVAVGCKKLEDAKKGDTEAARAGQALAHDIDKAKAAQDIANKAIQQTQQQAGEVQKEEDGQ